MGSRRASSRSSVGFFVAAAVIIAAAAAAFLITKGPAPPPRDQHASAPPPPAAGVPGSKQRTVKIYTIKLLENDAKLVPVEKTIPPGVDPHEAAIEELIAVSKSSGPIPNGTRLRGVTVRDGIAYADFSREIKQNFPGGSMNEALLVNSIIHTLTQFNDVKRVQILVEGEKIDSIGGHLDASEPSDGDSTLLINGAAE